jgi:16S rRNA (cytosine967-C5)-methyltransferase
LRLLHRSADVVRVGGRLVYSTCSSEPDENDDVVDEFLRLRHDFRAGEAPALPAAMAGLVDADGRLRTLPYRDGLEAFFAATLVKTRDSQ